MRLTSPILPFLFLLSSSLAPSAQAADSGTLYTNAVSYCAEAKAVVVEAFDIAYHQSNTSVTFTFSLASVESNLNVSANLYLNAYGIKLVNQTFNLCDYFQGVICPLPQVNFTGFGTYPIPAQYISNIPGIAYTVPNLEAYARIELIREGTDEVAACLQATLSNGKTTRHKAVSIATGVFTLVALLVGLWHTAANSPSPAQYRWFDILYLYQTAAATGLLHLNYPLVYSNFAENLSWALGLFHSSAVESSINRMRAKTGGHLDGNAYSEVQYINRRLSPYNTFVNINEFTPETFSSFISTAPTLDANSLTSRATIPSTLAQNTTTEINTGLPVYTNSLGIAAPNAFDTIFFFFLAFVAIAIAFHVLLFLVVLLVDRFAGERRGVWAIRLRRMWWGFCAGNALRLCLIWFLPIWIFGFYQYKIGDSGLSIFFAVFAMLLTLVPLATVFALSHIRNRRVSSTAPDISPLYTSYRWFHSVGVLYRPYRQRFHFFWFAPLILAMIARAGFIAFGDSHAWAQVIGNIVVEGIVFILMIACRPHKDRKGDWLAPFLSFCRLASFGLLIAFIPSMGVKPIPRTIIGFVIVVLFGIPTVLLLLGLIWNIGYGWLWRKHTHRIEDGLEVERFVASDDDSDRRPTMTQSHVDASQFVSAPAAMASRHNDSEPSVAGLTRRTSIMEPVDTVYEPSSSSHNHHYPSNGHQMGGYGSGSEYVEPSPVSPSLVTPVDPRYSETAYRNAAMGGHGAEDYPGEAKEEMDSRVNSPISPAPYGTRTNSTSSHGTMYYTPGEVQGTGGQGVDSEEGRRWSRDQYFQR